MPAVGMDALQVLRGFFFQCTSNCERCMRLLSVATDIAIVGYSILLGANHRRPVAEIEAEINDELLGKERFCDARKE